MCKNNNTWLLALSLAVSFLGSITVFAGEGEVRTDAQSYCFRTVNV